MVNVMDKMRKEFETWWSSTGHSGFVTNSDGNYVFSHTQAAWISWKASRAALCVELPSKPDHNYEGQFYDGVYSAIEQVQEILSDCGVSHK